MHCSIWAFDATHTKHYNKAFPNVCLCLVFVPYLLSKALHHYYVPGVCISYGCVEHSTKWYSIYNTLTAALKMHLSWQLVILYPTCLVVWVCVCVSVCMSVCSLMWTPVYMCICLTHCSSYGVCVWKCILFPQPQHCEDAFLCQFCIKVFSNVHYKWSFNR